ncbi:Fe-S cluster assembly protein SufD [Homoserinimonas sp. OAct 916]|uniref:Fe-S cluster assembly protein SufD n=1 Tax=Homoserinimonas sp. OAct 916 TaxID=2211450 RepID=UPI000DBE2402|nr:Fe-S cluster assembly protein SufD [Homoserinimonas sp. OAct 916]
MTVVSTPTTTPTIHEPVIPVQTRSERFASVNVEDFAPVTGREDPWRLTPLSRIEALANGEIIGDRYEVDSTPVDGISIGWIANDHELVGTAGTPEERASANAWGASDGALHVHVTGEDDKQATVSRAGFGSSPRGAHTVISAAPFSRGVVILENFGQAQLTENVEIIVGDGASLTVVSTQQWDDDAVHLASHFATVGRDAKLKHVVVSLGGSLVRLNPSVHLNTDGGDAELFGLYYADQGQHLEQRVFVNHDAAHTRSRVTYKGALQGDAARTVWVGDVLIRQSGTATDTYEENRNLILTPGARADSIPNLEIETGDIAGAGHASTSGRFDDEQLFYLQSRGINPDEARRLVVRGFLGEVVQQIGSPELEQRIHDAIEQELNQGVSA